MASYSISQLAALAGVSVRTLHHYDQLGLLPPAGRTAGDYRWYNQNSLWKLQQILMYRELQIPLQQIQQIMQQPDYDLKSCLLQQQHLLAQQVAQLQRLQRMLDYSLKTMESTMQQDNDQHPLFQHFSQAVLREEAIERWGEQRIQQSEQQVAALPQPQQQALHQQGELIAAELAKLRQLPADAPAVQALIARQHQWLLQYGACPLPQLLMLGEMYTSDARFKAYYDRFGVGTAELMRDGLAIYAQQQAPL